VGRPGTTPCSPPWSRPWPRAGTTRTSGSWLTRRTRTPAPGSFLRGRKIKHTIPEKSDQIARRKPRAPRAARPPGFDSETYKQRNTIERSFSRVKQWRGLATRYDKYAVTYLGGFVLGMVILTHRANH
jgi:putative transposase